jgi:4-hydroxythreonine-4-phosphate dehydrogenase
MGDPAGVGPELCLKALADPDLRARAHLHVIGDHSVLSRVGAKLHLPVPGRTVPLDACDALPAESSVVCATQLGDAVAPGRNDATCGRAAYSYVTSAIDLAKKGIVDAVTTAPLSKAALHMAGTHENGHTEIFARQTGVSRFAMLQYSPRLTCGFVTCHEPLRTVAESLSISRIKEVAHLMRETLWRITGKPPRLGMLGLNPHAGEEGAFGREEIEIIVPAAKQLRSEGVEVSDPIPPDAAFMPHALGAYDAYVCMYHDQGHIPFKMISLHDGVNVTMGLPIIRTSVDHGTAFDIAWQGKADPGSLFAAIRLASKLASAAMD